MAKPPPTPHPISDQLAELFPRMMMQLVRLGDGLPASAAGLTPQQLRVLTTLAYAGEPVRMSDLARSLHVCQSTVTDASKRLVRLGHLSRRRSDEDERVVCLSLTEKGRRTVEDLHQERRRLFRRVCAGMDARRCERLLRAHRFLLEAYAAVEADG